MASFIYNIRSTNKDASADVKVRIRFNSYYGKEKISTYAISGVELPKKVWDVGKCAVKANFQKPHEKECETLDAIKDFINERFNMLGEARISSEWLQGCVNEYWSIQNQILEDEKKVIEEIAQRETLNTYIDRYISEIADGSRLTNKNTKYRLGTVKAVRASMVQFKQYQAGCKIILDFADINLAFYRKYTSWLTNKGYTINSVGKCIKDLKTILDNAKDEEKHTNDDYKNRKFKVTQVDTDNIYLTQDELNAMECLDLSSMAQGYTYARDIFLVGCCLAQRVSDYNRLTEDNIITEQIMRINDKNRVEQATGTYILLTQQKTGARVKIPANRMVKSILAKYNNQLPYIWEQKLNQYIKIVARKAGITKMEQITSTKGGVTNTEFLAKCELVKSHTARRTGATLMYLSGMDIYDICKITGHTSIKNLRKYIKADELDVAAKMNKYDYFN